MKSSIIISFWRFIWFVMMISSTVGLLIVEIYSHDFSYNNYVALGMTIISLNFVIRTGQSFITLASWMIAKKEVEEEEEEVVETVVERKVEYTPEEMLERSLLRAQAENKFRDMNAIKSFERAKNIENMNKGE